MAQQEVLGTGFVVGAAIEKVSCDTGSCTRPHLKENCRVPLLSLEHALIFPIRPPLNTELCDATLSFQSMREHIQEGLFSDE